MTNKIIKEGETDFVYMMKLWILYINYECEDKDFMYFGNLWEVPGGYVVRAKTEKEARNMAHEHDGYGGIVLRGRGDSAFTERISIWLDPKYTICKALPVNGQPETIAVIDAVI